jgi:hypothetical protein
MLRDLAAMERMSFRIASDKLDAIEAVIPPELRRGQFTVPDRLIAMLRGQ